MRRTILTTILAGAVLASGLFADAPKRRQKRQQERIAQGVKSGELTPKETAKLERKEARLHKQIVKDRKDGGGLTPKERAKIDAKQDKLSREIYKEKHDAQKR
ncbi:MAG: hypothetical protein HYR60_11000 [Acidobacteria bacterium]|nr:hypothetical protein [Acidobacteriota bacterium]